MRRTRIPSRTRTAGIAAMILALSIATGTPAFAAVPGNDTYAGSTAVGGIPFSQLVDTTEATTDADDSLLNMQCGAPATDASVWYSVTAAGDGGLLADTSGSNYSAGVFVAIGTPGNWTVVACGPGDVAWVAFAGQTYSVVAFDDQTNGDGANGGQLALSIDNVPPPPVISATVNPIGVFNTRTGAVTVSGTVTCTGVSQFAILDVNLTQVVGRFTLSGFSEVNVTCDGATSSWSVPVSSDNGKFSGGKALSVTFALACGLLDCGFDYQEHVIHLKGGKR